MVLPARPGGWSADLISGLAMLAWAAAVIIRTRNSVEVNLIEEAPVICLAIGVLHNRLSGRGGSSGPEGGAGA